MAYSSIGKGKNKVSADLLTWPSAAYRENRGEHCRPSTLQIPQILPDEILCGHLARIYKINGLTRNVRPFHSWVLSKLEKTDRNHIFSELEMEAVACGMPVEKTAQLHTTLPFTRFVTSIDGSFPARAGYARPPNGSWEPPSCSSGKYCPDCLEEDLNFWGFAYARRTHQLPGVYWCTKHGSCLRFWWNYFFSPQTFPAYVVWSDYPSLSEAPALIRRYVEISTQLLSESVSIPVQVAHSRLRQRMEELKLDSSQTGLDHLFSQYPAAWLHQVIRLGVSRKPDTACFPVGILLDLSLQKLPAEKYVLLLALLFDDPDTALGYLKMPLSKGGHQNLEIAPGA